VESLIAGTPVISTDCPYGPSEILENYPQLLSPVGDVDSLAYNIVKYYTTPPEIDETLLDKFSIKNITGQLETIAEQVSQIVQFL
jgi:glycosyltransferase involved in cell wall biosynthesis